MMYNSIEPYIDILPNIQFGFERDPIKRIINCTSRTEQGLDQFGKTAKYLVADVCDYKNQWFALEFPLKNKCNIFSVRLRGYPIQRLFPILHYTSNAISQTMELPDFPIGEAFNTHILKLNELPLDARDLRLCFNVPDCEWFVLGLMSFESMSHE